MTNDQLENEFDEALQRYLDLALRVLTVAIYADEILS